MLGLQSLRRTVLPELVGEPETLPVDSTLLEVLHPRQANRLLGRAFDQLRWTNQ